MTQKLFDPKQLEKLQLKWYEKIPLLFVKTETFYSIESNESATIITYKRKEGVTYIMDLKHVSLPKDLDVQFNQFLNNKVPSK